MYNNIGHKIKTLATVIAVIGMIASLLLGVILISKEEFVLGIIVAAIGCLLSWLSSFTLFGYGCLIENTDALAEVSYRTLENTAKMVQTCNEIKKSLESKQNKEDNN